MAGLEEARLKGEKEAGEDESGLSGRSEGVSNGILASGREAKYWSEESCCRRLATLLGTGQTRRGENALPALGRGVRNSLSRESLGSAEGPSQGRFLVSRLGCGR